MNGQPDLFTPSGLRPMARQTDPETSRVAGREAQRRAPSQEAQIVNALKIHGPMNYWQIDNVCGFDHPTSARRLSKMVKRTVRLTGETRQTGKGHQAAIYVAT